MKKRKNKKATTPLNISNGCALCTNNDSSTQSARNTTNCKPVKKPVAIQLPKESSHRHRGVPNKINSHQDIMSKKSKNKHKAASSASDRGAMFLVSKSRNQPAHGDDGMEEYGMDRSQQRLLKQGFHPAVTSKTPSEIEKAWLARVDKLIQRPSREQFLGQDPNSENEFDIPFRYLTTAMLLLRYESRYSGIAKAPSAAEKNLLATIFNTVDIGGEVANHVFAEGWKTVFNAAVTSSTSWLSIAHSAKIWDFYASDLRTDGRSGVLLAVTPECTIGELTMANDLDPYGLDPTNTLSSWCQEAMKYEREIYLSIFLLHGRINRKAGSKKTLKQKQESQKIMPVEFMANGIVSAIKNIQNVTGIWGSSQFISSPKTQLFEPSAIFAADRLRKMLNHISEQRAALQVLYFEKVPFLDRRMIAVILRACPNVRMIGIYDCPLIHFGDVLCLIDLIHEVNCQRRRTRLPEITALDFYPKYNHGTPFSSANSATYGLTWGPHKLDVVQRGFFDIILKAFMKARTMKLGLLFDKGKAFCDYLHQVPSFPLAVPMFLDALHRYMEVRDERSKKKVIYDLLKPVRLGLERHMDHDWPHWYTAIMGKNLVFCSSCGYETLEEFYSASARDMQPCIRVCAGCTLQRWLDDEDDHLKEYKKQILDTLYPTWSGSKFNKDAPMPQMANGIIKLRSTISVRPFENPLTVDSEGHMYMRQGMLDLLRDNKVHRDSLQDLPTLSELLHGKKSTKIWGDLYNKCNNLDIYCRAVRLVHQQAESVTEKRPQIKPRLDGGMPDSVQELQAPQRMVEGIPCHDIASSIHFHVGLTKKGWGAL